MNGITQIKPFEICHVTNQDLILALLSDLGCSVSSIPRNYRSKAYSDKWELFDPKKVTNPENLPEHYAKIYELHNDPSRRDCVELRYRYVHVPTKILPQYPRVPCKGLFVLTDRTIKTNKISANNLIHIGNEIEEV